MRKEFRRQQGPSGLEISGPFRLSLPRQRQLRHRKHNIFKKWLRFELGDTAKLLG